MVQTSTMPIRIRKPVFKGSSLLINPHPDQVTKWNLPGSWPFVFFSFLPKHAPVSYKWPAKAPGILTP